MAPVVTALDHLQLPVRDLDEAIAWYSDVEDLGFARFLKFHDPSDNFLGAIEFSDVG